MAGRTISRAEIIDCLTQLLGREAQVHAAWLGGSDASGRTDRYSDIDLQVLVADDAVERVFGCIHAGLAELSPIEFRYRFPEPTWHGHSQEIFRLRDADPNHFLDLVVMKRSQPDRLLERERHGEPLVLFDRENLLVAGPLDWVAQRAKMEKRLADLRAQFRLYQPLVTRGVHRGHVAESAYAYQVLTLKLLIELLRMRFCPERYDFGPRYLDRDLPREWREEIERLAYPRTPAELLAFQSTAAAHFEEQLSALDGGAWSIAAGRA
jgi:predicted nucleotidyltransferase